MMGSAISTMLIVEDNPLDLELILRALRGTGLGHLCKVLRDGKEALDYLRGEGVGVQRRAGALPRVLLLDLKLPKLDGLEVLKLIRADPRLHALPVVVLTSSRELKDVRACYRSGVNSYIVKPVQAEEFSDVVQQVGRYWMHQNHPPLAEA